LAACGGSIDWSLVVVISRVSFLQFRETVMDVFCIGGGGKICREAILDLVQFSGFQRITVADVNEDAAREVGRWLDDPRVDAVRADVNDLDAAVARMREYDIVMDGTPISLNDRTAECIVAAGVHGINLNGMSREWELDEAFRRIGKTFVPGFGMTPGITNLMAKHVADQLDAVDSVRCSHGSFRPIAFSEAIAETTRIEYDPDLPSRVVFEDGQLRQVPPFARPREIRLPEPYGTCVQYIIPHPEPVTLSRSLADKGVRLVEARGTWPPRTMRLIRALDEWGILRNERVRVGDCEVGVLDAVFAHCLQSPEGQETDLYGYALHVEVRGTKAGRPTQHVLTHTHPPSDGSVPDWSGLRAYTRCVGIPMGIGAGLIAAGKAKTTGAVPPELAFDPTEVFAELEKRQIFIHEEIMSPPPED
jgi:saccharopine dehydrogenase-like NADP-dependent oxidoreductase